MHHPSDDSSTGDRSSLEPGGSKQAWRAPSLVLLGSLDKLTEAGTGGALMDATTFIAEAS